MNRNRRKFQYNKEMKNACHFIVKYNLDGSVKKRVPVPEHQKKKQLHMDQAHATKRKNRATRLIYS